MFCWLSAFVEVGPADAVVISALQTVPVLVAASVLVITVLCFLLRGSAGGRKRLPVTLQDPTVKYPLRLINKQVDILIICVVGSVQHSYDRKDYLECNDTDSKHIEVTLEMVSVRPSVSLQEISHDTKKFRFALPSENHILGLPVGTGKTSSLPVQNSGVDI